MTDTVYLVWSDLGGDYSTLQTGIEDKEIADTVREKLNAVGISTSIQKITIDRGTNPTADDKLFYVTDRGFHFEDADQGSVFIYEVTDDNCETVIEQMDGWDSILGVNHTLYSAHGTIFAESREHALERVNEYRAKRDKPLDPLTLMPDTSDDPEA